MKIEDMKERLTQARSEIRDAGDPCRRDPSDQRILGILESVCTLLDELIERTPSNAEDRA